MGSIGYVGRKGGDGRAEVDARMEGEVEMGREGLSRGVVDIGEGGRREEEGRG